MNTDYIPSLTHPSGQVLTIENWLAARVDIVSCDLAALLLKPGVDVLKNLKNLKQYWSWPGKILLNLSNLSLNAKKQCRIRSVFDGRILSFSKAEIIMLVTALKPDYITASKDFEELEGKAHALKENNQPAEDALEGIIYTKTAQFFLRDKQYEKAFISLEERCKCSTCKAGLTRAYLHHLYQHTPLLCQRFLVMHNLWVIHGP